MLEKRRKSSDFEWWSSTNEDKVFNYANVIL